MATVGRKKGTPRTGGRKKGTPNKTSAASKEAILGAFHGMGGERALTEWAKENPTDFYCRVLPKVLPKQVDIGGNGPGGSIPISVEIAFVSP